MFERHTIEAVSALAAIDKSVTPTEREMLQSVLCGGVTRREEADECLSYNDVAKRIKRSVATVKRLVKTGRIIPLKGTGDRALGISKSNLTRYMNAVA